MPTAATSHSLIERVRTADQCAWSEFVSIYYSMVYRWCRQSGLNPHDAADICQNVFRALADGFDSYRRTDESGSFRRWLRGVTRNKLQEFWRVSRTQIVSAEHGAVDGIADASELAGEEMEDSDLTLAVRRSLDGIREEVEPQTWQAPWQVLVEEQPPSDVASELGMSVNAVYKARARVVFGNNSLICWTECGRRLMTEATCPNQTVLSDYSLGRLDAESIEPLECHLDSCPRCQSLLASSLTDSDPLLRAFTGAGNVDDAFESEADMKRGMETILHAAAETFAGIQDKSPVPRLKRLRDYRIVREIGHGGMGSVYEALHERLDRTVAVKVLGASLVSDEQARSRFEREMKAVGRLDDPHIVRATDAGEESGMHYLVMEFVDGVDVSALIRPGAMTVCNACEIIRQAALGLSTVHQNDLVHRDIKPGNLMVTRAGRVKLLDLGLALLQKRPLNEDGLTGTGQIMGTVDYMAPEQITNTHEVDGRADLYSLGCVFYHLLSGQAPFADDSHPSAFEKLKSHAEREPASLATVRHDIPDTVLQLLSRLLVKDPTDRNMKPSELAAQLEPFVTGSDLPLLVSEAMQFDRPEPAMQSSQSLARGKTVDIVQPTLPLPDTQRKRPRRRLLLATLFAVLVTMLGVLYVNTGEGAVEVQINVPHATILIDDQPQASKPAGTDSRFVRITVGSGSHSITFRKKGFAPQTHTIRVLRHFESRCPFFPGISAA